MNRATNRATKRTTKQTGRASQEAPSDQLQQSTKTSDNELGCLLRVYWMMLGNVLLVAAAYKIAKTDGWLTLVDLVYWVFVLILITTRHVDIRFLRGSTSEGKPATMKDWRRYSLWVFAISVTLWLVVHGISYFVQ